MNTKKQERKKYWDGDYFDYWKSRVEEANKSSQNSSKIIKGDIKTVNDDIIGKLLKLVKIKQGKILDVGCGFGRSFKYFSKYKLSIYGIDISKKMVKESQASKVKGVIEIKEAEAEKIPYPDNYFDYVFGIGIFCATYQNKALEEMFRVLKTGGLIFIDGKNNNYFFNDQLAKDAEIGARKKGHPNFFTDVKNLRSQLVKKKHKIIIERYFLKRGDFADFKFENKMPKKFYEYFIVIKKGSNDSDFSKFFYDYSNILNA